MLVPISQTRREPELENKTIRATEEANGNKNNLTEGNLPIFSVANYKGKELNRKYDKKVSNLYSSKRPRTDRLGSHGISVQAENNGIIFQKDEADATRCTSNDSILMVKQNHGQESKRLGKKNLRSTLRVKCESSSSKAWLASCNSNCGGSEGLGSYGLSSELCDITKHLDDLNLSELLEGNYKNSNTLPTKGKRSQNSTNDIMLSLRKAFSILPPHCPAAGDGNRDDALSLLKPSTMISDKTGHVKIDEDKDIHELVSEFKDSHQAKSSNSTLCQANEILEHLALSPGQNLDVLLLDLNQASDLSRSSVSKVTHAASLPYFLWSNCHVGGGCKSNADMVRLVSSRVPCTGRWYRIESNYSARNNSCFSDLELAAFSSEKELLIQRKSCNQLKHMPSCCKQSSEEASGGIDSVKYLPGHSPRALLAAEILFGISRCCKVSNLKLR